MQELSEAPGPSGGCYLSQAVWCNNGGDDFTITTGWCYFGGLYNWLVLLYKRWSFQFNTGFGKSWFAKGCGTRPAKGAKYKGLSQGAYLRFSERRCA